MAFALADAHGVDKEVVGMGLDEDAVEIVAAVTEVGSAEDPGGVDVVASEEVSLAVESGGSVGCCQGAGRHD